MARKNKKKRKPGGGAPPPTADQLEKDLQEIEGVMRGLEANPDEPAEWGRLQRLLLKAKAEPGMVARAVIGRDLEVVKSTLNVLRGMEETQEAPEPPPLPEVPEDILRSAMRAYRKRIKLMKLDHESKIGQSPLTSGKDAGFDSILPPKEYDSEVWQVLAARGELEATGQGFYKLPTERPSF